MEGGSQGEKGGRVFQPAPQVLLVRTPALPETPFSVSEMALKLGRIKPTTQQKRGLGIRISGDKTRFATKQHSRPAHKTHMAIITESANMLIG